jgi:hypothetical protein
VPLVEEAATSPVAVTVNVAPAVAAAPAADGAVDDASHEGTPLARR